MAAVYIGLGANLGDRETNIRRALTLIRETGAGEVKKVSKLIETEPVGGPAGQGPYLNGAALVETKLSPHELLHSLKEIERNVGRVERERWAAREVDIDILFYNDEVIRTPLLEVPHPRLAERRFVLEPLAEIAPDKVHPTAGRTVRELLTEIEGKE